MLLISTAMNHSPGRCRWGFVGSVLWSSHLCLRFFLLLHIGMNHSFFAVLIVHFQVASVGHPSRDLLPCNTEIRMTCKCLPMYAALVPEATNIRVSQITIYLPTGIRAGSTLSHPATVIEARAFGLL
jgi:hypothetical protein